MLPLNLLKLLLPNMFLALLTFGGGVVLLLLLLTTLRWLSVIVATIIVVSAPIATLIRGITYNPVLRRVAFVVVGVVDHSVVILLRFFGCHPGVVELEIVLHRFVVACLAEEVIRVYTVSVSSKNYLHERPGKRVIP